MQEGFPRPACERSQDRPRPASRLIEALEPGDVLMVTRLDRLARSTRDLLNTLAAISDRKAGFRSLGDAWADIARAADADRARRACGVRARPYPGPHRRRARAKANGKHLGRPFKLTPHQQKEAIKRRDQGGESLAEIGRSYNVSAATISRLAP
jgi:DNA invertase Pin-like site-specific DNA recombinase